MLSKFGGFLIFLPVASTGTKEGQSSCNHQARLRLPSPQFWDLQGWSDLEIRGYNVMNAGTGQIPPAPAHHPAGGEDQLQAAWLPETGPEGPRRVETSGFFLTSWR